MTFLKLLDIFFPTIDIIKNNIVHIFEKRFEDSWTQDGYHIYISST